jgi:hypothetical protein
MTPHKLIAACLILLPISAQSLEKPSSARISNVSLRGNGCDANSTNVVLSPDNGDLSVLFDNYGVEIGQGSVNPGARKIQKDCTITVDFEIPNGWSFAFHYVDYRGFAGLPAGAWGFQRLSYVTSLRQVSSARELTLNGPYNDVYTMRSMQRPERLAWTPCNSSKQRIELYSQLSVNYLPTSNSSVLAQMALDTADLSMSQNFGVLWRRCGPDNVVPPNPGGPRPGPIRPRRI